MWRCWHIDRKRVSPAASGHLEMQLCLLKKLPFEMPSQSGTQLCLSLLNIYQGSKGQDQGTDPSAQGGVGGKCPDTSQHREETLPHLLSPSQRLWCCHTGKEPTSASGSACMDSWRLDEGLGEGWALLHPDSAHVHLLELVLQPAPWSRSGMSCRHVPKLQLLSHQQCHS